MADDYVPPISPDVDLVFSTPYVPPISPDVDLVFGDAESGGSDNRRRSSWFLLF